MSLNVRGFVLGVVLLALVGWCIVQESISQTQLRYKLAELTRREGDIRRTLEKLDAEEEGLRSPDRLARLSRERRMDLIVLTRAAPDGAEWAGGRRPGDVLDDDFAKVERPPMVASVGYR